MNTKPAYRITRPRGGLTRIFLTALFIAGFFGLHSCATFEAQATWETKVSNQDLVVFFAKPSSEGQIFQITGEALQGAKITGFAVPEGDNYLLTITALRWFNNWNEGWTEAYFIATGKLLLTKNDKGWSVVIKETPHIDLLQEASLRLYGDYFYGDKALGLLSRRWERIQAMSDYLLTLDPTAEYETLAPVYRWESFRWTKNFKEGVGSKLFPEIYGYPQGSQRGQEFSTAESVSWDKDYTLKNFPENLREIRQSGTLLRDFEESPGLWLLAQQWKKFWEQKVPSSVFHIKN